MKKVKYKDETTYIDDTEIDENKTDAILKTNDKLDDTQEIELDEELLSKTMTDIWGGKDE